MVMLMTGKRTTGTKNAPLMEFCTMTISHIKCGVGHSVLRTQVINTCMQMDALESQYLHLGRMFIEFNTKVHKL